MHIDTSRTFDVSILDESTGTRTTIRAAATTNTEDGQQLVFDADGKSYIRSAAMGLVFIPAPQFDVDRELSDAPKPASYDSGDWFAAQVYRNATAGESEIVRVKTIGDSEVEDADGRRYRRNPQSMRLILVT